ncbi:TorF family putative porin [Oceanobacter kriegii]|uniref:TorF family putative porin n=1 Tax=Oceanobacter kriegii TaxID=64972 RepID=UPI0004221319|nr:TorF family putative porin [Oceanobacter kriegii]
MKKLSQVIALAGAMTAGLAAVHTAQAEVSASVDVASSYLWRGQNLSAGSAVVAGSLDYSHESGLYLGAWTSSGDSELGTETDFYVGFAGEAGDLGYDLGYVTYIYTETADDEFDDAAEFYLGLSYDIAGLTLYKNSDFDVDGLYGVVDVAIPDTAFSVALGSNFDTGADYTHIDVSYAYNDQISFTASKIIDEEVDDSMDKSTRYVVSYSLPIEM